ncbi:MAG: hypothetical protein IPP79_20985 [Chitinophagaceae bacterium]|nr:hypothetical protein [Chitinophagaceae bacterium]
MNRKTKSKRIFETLKIQLYISMLLLLVFFLSCKSGSDKTQTDSSKVITDTIPSAVTQNDTIDAVVKSIIDLSANDFYKNQQPLPTEFRNVKFRYSIKPNKEILYYLCGQFKTRNSDEWTHFTTIKNIDYEQWIGPSGLTYCENSEEIPYNKTDLSVELINRLNSLQKIEK